MCICGFCDFRHDQCDAVNAINTIDGQVECSLLHFDSNVTYTELNVIQKNSTTVIIKGELVGYHYMLTLYI